MTFLSFSFLHDGYDVVPFQAVGSFFKVSARMSTGTIIIPVQSLHNAVGHDFVPIQTGEGLGDGSSSLGKHPHLLVGLCLFSSKYA